MLGASAVQARVWRICLDCAPLAAAPQRHARPEPISIARYSLESSATLQSSDSSTDLISPDSHQIPSVGSASRALVVPKDRLGVEVNSRPQL